MADGIPNLTPTAPVTGGADAPSMGPAERSIADIGAKLKAPDVQLDPETLRRIGKIVRNRAGAAEDLEDAIRAVDRVGALIESLGYGKKPETAVRQSGDREKLRAPAVIRSSSGKGGTFVTDPITVASGDTAGTTYTVKLGGSRVEEGVGTHCHFIPEGDVRDAVMMSYLMLTADVDGTTAGNVQELPMHRSSVGIQGPTLNQPLMLGVGASQTIDFEVELDTGWPGIGTDSDVRIAVDVLPAEAVPNDAFEGRVK